MDKKSSDIVIIGAGAAGLMAAHFCGKNGKKVFLLDHNEVIGRKILISGGGRCNFTNLHSEPNDFHSKNPHFCKSALSRYTPYDFIELVEKNGIKYVFEIDGSSHDDKQCYDNHRASIIELYRYKLFRFTNNEVINKRKEVVSKLKELKIIEKAEFDPEDWLSE